MSDSTTIKGGGGDHDHDRDHDHKHHHVHGHDHDHQHDDSHKGSGDNVHTHHGHDTINLGSGHDTLVHAGNATVHGSIEIRFQHSSHSATLAGGSHSTSFLQTNTSHGIGSVMGGSAHISGKAFVGTHGGGTDIIKNFVSGHDKLYLEGKSMSYLQGHHDVTVSHGSTHISLNGGATTVSLKGFSHL